MDISVPNAISLCIAVALPLYIYHKGKEDDIRKQEAAAKATQTLQKADLALQKIDEHTVECDQIRKEVLLEKIHNVDDKLETFLEDTKVFREDVKKAFLRSEEKFDKLNDFLLKNSNPNGN